LPLPRSPVTVIFEAGGKVIYLVRVAGAAKVE
jgi:hypothetical protein